MLPKLISAWCLMAGCVAIHASAVASALRWLRRRPNPQQAFWPWTWLFIQLAGWMILFHLFEISIWAFLYFGGNAITDLSSAFYFSVVTYTTTGYGDLTLPEPWRLVGGIEALTGILMCGWSTGFFFAVVSRVYESTQGTRDRMTP
jgi:hypothetical protein